MGDGSGAFTGVAESPGKGRALFARSSCQRGDLIYLEERPMAAHAATDVCGACFRLLEVDDRLPCLGCHAQFYCTNACRERESLEHTRSGDCEAASRGADIEARMAIRLLFGDPERAKDLEAGETRLLNPPAEDSEGVQNVARDLAESARIASSCSGLPFDACAQAVCRRVDSKLTFCFLQAKRMTEGKEQGTLMSHMALCCRCCRNAFDVAWWDGKRGVEACFGAAIYHFASSANHSCRPNACFSFRRDFALQLRACQRISPGDEITIPYLDLLQGSKARQQELWEKHRFLCSCDRCREGALSPDWFLEAAGSCRWCSSWLIADGQSCPNGCEEGESSRGLQQLGEALDGSFELFVNGLEPMRALELLQPACAFAIQNKMIHPFHSRALDSMACLAAASSSAAHSLGNSPAMNARSASHYMLHAVACYELFRFGEPALAHVASKLFLDAGQQLLRCASVSPGGWSGKAEGALLEDIDEALRAAICAGGEGTCFLADAVRTAKPRSLTVATDWGEAPHALSEAIDEGAAACLELSALLSSSLKLEGDLHSRSLRLLRASQFS